MKVKIDKLLIEEAIHRINISNYSKIDSLKTSKLLIIELLSFLKQYKIPKEAVVLFGSIVLGLKGLREPNDLDIGLKKEYMDVLKKFFPPTRGSYGAQYDIGKLSFIHELALPKIGNKGLFEITTESIKGIKIISFEQWKQMQLKDPLQKDKKFL